MTRADALHALDQREQDDQRRLVTDTLLDGVDVDALDEYLLERAAQCARARRALLAQILSALMPEH